MAGIPIIIVASGGLPAVSVTDKGIPATEVQDYGLPVTLGDRGLPLVIDSAFSIALTGLSSNGQYGSFAQVGDHASISATVDAVPNTPMNWSAVQIGDTDLGALTVNPGDFSASDTGNPNVPGRLYYEDPVTGASGSVAIRAALPTISVDAAISAPGPDIGDTITLVPATFADVPAQSTRLMTMTRDAASFQTNAGAGNLTHDIVAADDDLLFDGTDAITCSGGVVTSDATGSVQVTDFETPAVTSAPVVTAAKIGAATAFTPPVFTGNPTPSVAYETLIDGAPVGDETYVLAEGDDTDTVSIRATATNALGSVQSTSATLAVTYNAPVAAGGLADQSFSDDTGNQTFDPTGDFTVSGDGDLSGVTWSLPTTVAGVTINPATGLITFDTDALNLQNSTAIVVRGANSGGQADSGFSFSITAGVASLTINSIGPQAATGNVPFDYTIDVDDTVEALLVRDGTAAPVAADFNGAQSGPNVFDLGPVALTVSGSGINLTGPTGQLDDFRLYLLPTGGGDGDIAASPLFALDSTDLSISSSTPADDAVDIAANANITINFDDDVAATGTITLRLVGGAAIETFDLSVGTGDNGGTVGIAGAVVTIDPGSDMAVSTAHCLRTSGLTDTNANPLPDITDDTTLNFTTVAPASFDLTLINNQNIGSTSVAASTASNNYGNGDTVAVILDHLPDPVTADALSVTIAGQAATRRAGGSGDPLNVGSFYREVWEATVADGASGVITVTPTGGELGQLNVVSARVTGGQFKSVGVQTVGSEFTQTVSLATAAGDLAFASATYTDAVQPTTMAPASMSNNAGDFIQPTDPQNYFASVSTAALTAGTTDFVMTHDTELVRQLTVVLFEATP